MMSKRLKIKKLWELKMKNNNLYELKIK